MYVRRKNPRRSLGYSLIELLMVVAVLSSVAAGGVVTLTNVTRAAESSKLQRDVAVINRAIHIYLVNGGTFLKSDLRNTSNMLSKLKSRATDASAKRLAGMRGSMADERLNFELQSTTEGASDAERARFIADASNPRFTIETTGGPGIRRFFLDASLAGKDYGTAKRTGTLNLAKTDPWVWDYTDTPNGRATPDTNPATDPDKAPAALPEDTNLPLNPPGFSLPSGTDQIYNYPKILTLLPTNPSGTSEILYSLNSGPFIPFGGSLSIPPGTSVTAISHSLDPDHYDDSPTANREYLATPFTPVAGATFTKTGYTYFELGGSADPATPAPLPAAEVKGSGSVTNLSQVPVSMQNSNVFRYVWTVDGSNPLTSASAQKQPDFTGGFTAATLPLPLTAFGTAGTATFKGAVKSANPTLMNDSAVVTTTLNAVVTPLRAPLITLDGRDVTLAPDLSGRDTPPDTRIYYTVDGTDPGIGSSGNPQRGTLYTGVPFTLEGAMGVKVTVTARTYAPLAFVNFFTTSPPAAASPILPAVTEVYVGGIFVNSGGTLMRNIAKLNNSGAVDTRFNTGSGASDDSFVGVVRQGAGGVMAGGDFATMNGVPRAGAVLLTPAGGVDTSFDAALSND